MNTRATELERDIDRVLSGWLAGLATWTPALSVAPGERPIDGVCAVCLHYSEDLQLDELPHEVLHPLATALDAAIVQHAEAWATSPLIASDDELAAVWQDVVAQHAIARVLARYGDISFAVHAYVEPRVQRLVDELLEAVCAG